MEVKKYKMARSWLTDPDSGNSAGQWKNFVQQRKQEWKAREGFKGAGLVDQGLERQGFKRGKKVASVADYLDDFRKMAVDNEYVPKHIKPATEGGMTKNQIEAKKLATEEISNFEELYNKNINRRKKIKQKTSLEASIIFCENSVSTIL